MKALFPSLGRPGGASAAPSDAFTMTPVMPCGIGTGICSSSSSAPFATLPPITPRTDASGTPAFSPRIVSSSLEVSPRRSAGLPESSPECSPRKGVEGEWPGAVPAKFHDKVSGRMLCRRIVPTDKRRGQFEEAGFEGFFEQNGDGTAQASDGKRSGHGEASPRTWRPTKRILPVPGGAQSDAEQPRGLRLVEAPRKLPPSVIPERRHLRPIECKEEHRDLPQGKMTIKQESGLRAHDQRGMEQDLSHMITRRRRKPDLASQRNGIECRSLGDKCYQHPEYESGFYQPGGLAVGSTFVRGDFPKTTSRTREPLATPRKELRSKEPHLTYKELEDLRIVQEVGDLTNNWEGTVLKEYYDRTREVHGSDRRGKSESTKEPPAKQKSGAKDLGVQAMWDLANTVDIWENLDSDSDDGIPEELVEEGSS